MQTVAEDVRVAVCPPDFELYDTCEGLESMRVNATSHTIWQLLRPRSSEL